jgi:hypothetical protein
MLMHAKQLFGNQQAVFEAFMGVLLCFNYVFGNWLGV